MTGETHERDTNKSWFNSFLIRFCWEWGNRRVAIYSWDDKHCFVWRHWRCQRILFPARFNGIWVLIKFFLGQVLLGMRSQEGSHLQPGWLLGTLKVSTHTVSTWVQWHMALPHHWVGIKFWFNSFWVGYCWGMVLLEHWVGIKSCIHSFWRCQEILFPPRFSGISYFPTIGLELNRHLILSWWEWGPRRVTGGLEWTQGSWALDSVEHNMVLCCEICENKTCMLVIVERCCCCYSLHVLVECSWKPRSLRLPTQSHHSVCPWPGKPSRVDPITLSRLCLVGHGSHKRQIVHRIRYYVNGSPQEVATWEACELISPRRLLLHETDVRVTSASEGPKGRRYSTAARRRDMEVIGSKPGYTILCHLSVPSLSALAAKRDCSHQRPKKQWWKLKRCRRSTGTIKEFNPDFILSEGVPRWNAIAEKNKE